MTLRHSRNNHRTQTSSFRAQSRNPSPACQGTSPGIQRPLRSPMDTATSRSMTAVGIPRAVAESSAPCAQTSSFRAPSRHSRSAPSAPNFVIPRAVAESISRLPRHQPRNPAPFAIPYGYCDFAQYDGCWYSEGSCRIQCPLRPNFVVPRAQTSPFRAPSRHSRSAPSAPNFVIPRTVAESISRLPRHQPRNPAPFALPYGYCDFAQHDGCWYSKGSCGIQCPLRPNFVIPRPIPSFPKCPQRPKLRHSARSRGIHFPPAKAPATESSALCAPLWILRLRAV